MPVPFNVERILPHEQGCKAIVDQNLRSERGLAELGDRLAPAKDAVMGLDPDEGHTALRATVVGLWIDQGKNIYAADHVIPFSVFGDFKSQLIMSGSSGLQKVRGAFSSL
jgi:hypothetical protein